MVVSAVLPVSIEIYEIILNNSFYLDWGVLAVLLVNTAILSISALVTLFIAIPIAYMIYAKKHRFRIALFCFFSLFMLPISLVGKIGYLVLAYDGPIHSLITILFPTNQNVDWFAIPSYSYAIIILIISAASIAEAVLYIRTGLERIPYSVIEAAQCDGATNISIVTNIILPSIKDVLILYSLNIVSWIATSSYSLISQITGGGPGLSTTTFDSYIIRYMFGVSGKIGEGIAMSYSMILFFVYFVIGVLSLLFGKRDEIV